MSLSAKRELIRQLNYRERRLREAPLLSYRPHPGQVRFHEAGRQYRRRLTLAPNRWGKTRSGCQEALAHAYGYRFWEVPNLRLDAATGDLPPRERIPQEYWVLRQDTIPLRVPNNGLCITGLNAQRGIGQVIYPGIEEILPPTVKQHADYRVKWESQAPVSLFLPNRSRIYFGSAQQDPITFEGFSLDWSWADEPIPRRHFNAIWRSLTDRYGPIWFTQTPLGRNAVWQKNWRTDPGIWVSERGLRQRDNPYLSEDAIREFEENGEYSPAERRARLEGEYECAGSLVFPTFDTEVHVVPSRPIARGWLVGQTVDPHHRRPAYTLWWAVDPLTEGRPVYHFFREWPTQDFFQMESGGLSPTEYAVLYRQIEGARAADLRLCDPRFGKARWSPLGKEGTIWIEEMEKCGLLYEAEIPGVSRIEIGHVRITEALRWDRNFPLGPTNTPQIFVHDCCRNLIRAFENYSYEDTEPEQGSVEKIEEQFKDPIDAVRYTVLYELPYFGRQGAIDGQGGNFSELDLRRENVDEWW